MTKIVIAGFCGGKAPILCGSCFARPAIALGSGFLHAAAAGPVLHASMNICCPRCGGPAEPAGHEDARAFFQCPTCSRVWATHISGRVTHTPPASEAPRVLLADDSREMLGLLTAWLEDEGCVVIPAASGREAIEAGESFHPDVALIDIVLPPPDGFSVSEALTRRCGVSVVLMTGMSSPDMRRVEEVGALMLLKKPFDREGLLDAVTLGLEHCRRKDASGGTACATP